MPRFFFDVHVQTGAVTDAVGVDVPDAASALRGCIEAIEEGWLASVERLVIRDEHGRVLACLYVRAIAGVVDAEPTGEKE